MKTKRMMRILSLLAALTMLAALVSGCGGTPAEGGSDAEGGGVQQSSAMSEEEYLLTIDQMMQDYLSATEDLASVDASDADAAKDALNATKAPFESFMQVKAPEKYAQADEKLKAGCQAWNDFIDLSVSTVDETDPAKIAESASKLAELTQTIQTNFQEASELLASAG